MPLRIRDCIARCRTCTSFLASCFLNPFSGSNKLYPTSTPSSSFSAGHAKRNSSVRLGYLNRSTPSLFKRFFLCMYAIYSSLIHSFPYTYIHTYINSHKHTYVHTYQRNMYHTCIHAYINIYLQSTCENNKQIHTYINTYIHT
jgi:hypothetical protein